MKPPRTALYEVPRRQIEPSTNQSNVEQPRSNKEDNLNDRDYYEKSFRINLHSVHKRRVEISNIR